MGEGVDLFIRKNIGDSGSLFLSLIKSHRFSSHCTLKIYFHSFISRLKDENCLMWLSLVLSMLVWRQHLDHQHGMLESGPKNRFHLSCPCRAPFLALCSVWKATGQNRALQLLHRSKFGPKYFITQEQHSFGVWNACTLCSTICPLKCSFLGYCKWDFVLDFDMTPTF